MSVESSLDRPGKAAFWTGWALSVLIAIAMVMGGVTDLLKLPFVLEGLERAHFHEEVLVPLGLVVIASAILFLIPRTAIFGAVLLTAYLGGAVTVHAQLHSWPADAPRPATTSPAIFTEYPMIVAPVLFCTVMWVALMLRDLRFRRLLF